MALALEVTEPLGTWAGAASRSRRHPPQRHSWSGPPAYHSRIESSQLRGRMRRIRSKFRGARHLRRDLPLGQRCGPASRGGTASRCRGARRSRKGRHLGYHSRSGGSKRREARHSPKGLPRGQGCRRGPHRIQSKCRVAHRSRTGLPHEQGCCRDPRKKTSRCRVSRRLP